MTISPDGETFILSTKTHWCRMGNQYSEAGSKTRLTAYSTATGKPKAEYVVEVNPTYAPRPIAGTLPWLLPGW